MEGTPTGQPGDEHAHPDDREQVIEADSPRLGWLWRLGRHWRATRGSDVRQLGLEAIDGELLIHAHDSRDGTHLGALVERRQRRRVAALERFDMSCRNLGESGDGLYRESSRFPRVSEPSPEL